MILAKNILLISVLVLLRAQESSCIESESSDNDNTVSCSSTNSDQSQNCYNIAEPAEKNHSGGVPTNDNRPGELITETDEENWDDEDDYDENEVEYCEASDDEDDYEYDEDDDDDDEEEVEQDDENLEYEASFLALNVWGKPQRVEGSEEEQEQTKRVVEKTKDYMLNQVLVEEQYEDIRPYCLNYNTQCSLWAAQGECDINSDWMVEYCSPACLTCGELEIDFEAEAKEQKELLFDNDPPESEVDKDGEIVPIPWGVPQHLGTTFPDKVRELMKETAKYMMETVFVNQTYEKVYEECENRAEECSHWAVHGECEKNPDFMKVHCAPACGTCEYIDFNTRCPIDPDAFIAWPKEGDVNRFFERIVNDTYWEENHGPITVLSSPSTTGGPWVITIDNFLTEEETKRLIEFGYQEGFERSTDVGEADFDGTQTKVESSWRTSENAWCPQECQDDPITSTAYERVDNLTGIPYMNAEWWQLLRYEPGQYYMEHHDYITMERKRPQGPRILTAFFYLNDVVAGGGTRFTTLDITVNPKRGRAVLWPSVKDKAPMRRDKRTMHEALSVQAGVKYGANAWFHQRDFKTRHEEGCV